MGKNALFPFKQDGEPQNLLTPQPPKDNWMNGRRKRPSIFPRNMINSSSTHDDVQLQLDTQNNPPPPLREGEPTLEVSSSGMLPSLSSENSVNEDEIVAFFSRYMSEEDESLYQKQMREAQLEEQIDRASIGQMEFRLARKAQRKPFKMPPIIRAEESYKGKAKEERLERLRATPINDSPAQLSGDSHQLPERRSDAKYTVVLDIDYTLVHAVREKPPKYEFQIDVSCAEHIFRYYVSVRPFVKELLDYLRENKEFEVIVFTAAKEEYGREIIRCLDPKGTLDHHFLSEIHIRQSGEIKAKDLQRLGRPVESICIVEDTPESYKYQKRSSFPLSRWKYDMDGDMELKDLIGVLEKVKKSGNLIGQLDDFKASKLSNQSFKIVLGAGDG